MPPQPEKRPMLNFLLGTNEMRINMAAQQALGQPMRVTGTFQEPSTYVLRPVPEGVDDGVSVQIHTGAFGGQGRTKKMLAAGYRKDRRYIGVARDNTLTFSVDRWEERT